MKKIAVTFALAGILATGTSLIYSSKARSEGRSQNAGAPAAADCRQMESCDRPESATRLTKDQVDTIANWAAQQILSTGELASVEEIASATGIAVSAGDVPALWPAVMAVLSKDPRGQKFLQGHRCTRFQACSFTRIISSPDDIEAAWLREKAEDGRTYEDFQMPGLKGRDLSGQPVRSDDLKGRPAIVALLSLHCNHSVETLPILTELAARFSTQRVRVVGVFVNSRSAEEVNYWVPQLYPDYNGQYEVWVADDTSIGDAVNSHLTPTYLFVDAEGQVRKKLVGFKSEDDVRNQLASALDLGGSRPATP